MKILITGASGRVGSGLIKHLDSIVSPDDEIVLLKRINPVDTESIKQRKVSIISEVEDSKPYDLAIHFAGNIHTSRGSDPANYPEFIRDNVELTERVCDASKRVFFASTENIFSGMDNMDYLESHFPQESGVPSGSRNYYGQTKAIAEKVILDNKGCVVRIQSPLGVPRNLIVDRVIGALEDSMPSWPFWNDQFLRPTFIDDIALVLRKLSQTDKEGVYHVSCSGNPLSRAEIANKVLDVYREYDLPRVHDSVQEEPCNDPNFPRRLVLDTQYTRKELGIEQFTSVDNAIKTHILRIKKPELYQ